jgi:hypothetical protein
VEGAGSRLHVGQSIVGDHTNRLLVRDNGFAHVDGNIGTTPRLENGVLSLAGTFTAHPSVQNITGTSGVLLYNEFNLTPSSTWSIHRPLEQLYLEIDLFIFRSARFYSLGPADLGPLIILNHNGVVHAPDGLRLGDNRRLVGPGTVAGQILLANGIIDTSTSFGGLMTEKITGYGVLIGAAPDGAPTGAVHLRQDISMGNRNGTVFTWDGVLHYKAARHARELDIPLDARCGCYTCRNFSRAYLRHLFVAGEYLALELASLHTLTFYQDLMREARTRIISGTYENWKTDLLARWERGATV